jgi:hypothetical protein
MKVHNLLVTGSHTSSGEDIRLISSSVATINNAQNGRLDSIESITGSLVSKTGSFATTGSNVFIGTQTISGSLIPAVDNTYDLGSITHQFRDLYLSSASLYIDGTKVLSSTTQELQITTDAGQSFKILEAGSDTITLQSNDGNITLATSGGGDVIMDPTNGIIALKGTTTIYAGNRILSSDGNNIHFGNGVVISGSLLATGTNLISGSSQILNGSGIISSSTQLPSGIVSSSSQVTGYGFSTTGSNTFQGTQVVTGSLFISENLIVAGSSSIQHISSSVVNIADNIVTVNALNPSVRFGGLAVIDSGSNPQVSGSMLFDSVNNQWLFVHQNQGTVTSSVLLMGPETYNDLGNESYITANRLVKSTGIEHLTNSNISDTGTKVSINSNTEITGTFVATGTALVSGSAQITYGSISSIPSGIVSGSAQILNGTGFVKTSGASITYDNSTYLTTESDTLSSVTARGASTSTALSLGQVSTSTRLSVGGSDQNYASIFVGGAITSGTNQYAILTDPQLAGTGDNYAVFANARIKASTAVNNTFGVYIPSAEKLSGASIVNNYALYIANQTAGSTINYSIYSSGGLNYFGGATTFNSSLTAESGYFNKPSATNGTSLIVRQTTAGGNGNQDIGLVVDIQGANDLDRIANFRYYNGSTYTSRFSVLRDGKVGVGYLTPTVALQVSGTIASGDGDNGWGRFLYDAGTVKIQASKNGTDPIGISFWTQASGGAFSEKVSIAPGGNMGVGNFGGNAVSSLLELRNSEATLYDQTVDNGQDSNGVSLTIRNNDTSVVGSFSQINMQVSGDSGRALGRIVTIRMGSATSDMAFVTEDANVKAEKLRIASSGTLTSTGPGLIINRPASSSGEPFIFFNKDGTTRGSIYGGDGTAGLRFFSSVSTFSGNIMPSADATHNLGSTSLRWNNLYTTDLHLSNEGKQNIVDGTWGDWTLQEGEHDIFMLNNRSGEKFKIKLEKIIQ